MNLKDSVEQVADFLWDLVTSDPGDSVQRFSADPSQYLADHGHDGLTADDLDAAFGRLADRLPADQFAQVMPMRAATQGLGPMGGGSGLGGGGMGGGGGLGSNASMAAHMAAAPRSQPQVVRHIHEQRVTQARETSTQPQQQQHVTEEHHNITNNYVREGDTTVDNRTITEIHARGDVDFDQRIDTHTVIATKGGVAIEGDVEDAAINTGKNSGILAGDDVELEDSIVGDGNTQVTDSEVGALSGKGNATNVNGENVNMGSGDLTAVRAGGDAQVADGNGNRFSGDTDVDFDRVDGPIDLAIGDENRQQAEEDNSTEVEDSYNTDNSTEGSQNTSLEESANRLTSDNDGQLQQVDSSFNQSVEDNDTSRLSTDGTNGTAPQLLAAEGQAPGYGEHDPLAPHGEDGQLPGGEQLDGSQLPGDGLGGDQLLASPTSNPLDQFDDDLDDI